MTTHAFFSAPFSRIRRTFVAAFAALALAAGVGGFAAPASATSAPDVNTLRSWAYQMWYMMNGERLNNHIHSLAMNYYLRVSASRHDLQMAQYDQMSHRLPGEPDLAPRIVAAGYSPWCYVAENVAWTTDISYDGAMGVAYLQNYMYSEKAPNDGHRQNILNPHLHDVGITIVYDSAHRKLWITQDFGSHTC